MAVEERLMPVSLLLMCRWEVLTAGRNSGGDLREPFRRHRFSGGTHSLVDRSKQCEQRGLITDFVLGDRFKPGNRVTEISFRASLVPI